MNCDDCFYVQYGDCTGPINRPIGICKYLLNDRVFFSTQEQFKWGEEEPSICLDFRTAYNVKRKTPKCVEDFLHG
jgi:hypothetical protein